METNRVVFSGGINTGGRRKGRPNNRTLDREDAADEVVEARGKTSARVIGLQIQVLKASTSREIEAAFATLVRERADALFIAPDALFSSRRSQLATLAP